MVEHFRQIAKGLGWRFVYGRRDYMNLTEVEGSELGTKFLFLDPVRYRPKYGESGGMVCGEYTGKFMVLQRSELSEEYDNEDEQVSGKWQLYIRPIQEAISKDLYRKLVCGQGLEVSWSMVDVVNVFSENMDGVIVDFRITDHDQ